MGDGSQVLNDLVLGHADAGILNSKGTSLFVRCDADTQFDIGVQYIPVRQHLETDAVECIRSVREQFAQEHVPIFVQGMDQDIKKLFSLGLEGE